MLILPYYKLISSLENISFIIAFIFARLASSLGKISRAQPAIKRTGMEDGQSATAQKLSRPRILYLSSDSSGLSVRRTKNSFLYGQGNRKTSKTGSTVCYAAHTNDDVMGWNDRGYFKRIYPTGHDTHATPLNRQTVSAGLTAATDSGIWLPTSYCRYTLVCKTHACRRYWD